LGCRAPSGILARMETSSKTPAQAITIRPRRDIEEFGWSAVIGTLGGLIGLGGAEFRLPVLVGRFGFPTLEAVILNKALSLVVVVAALLFRQRAIPFDETLAHAGTVLNLLAGSLVGAWFAAGHAIRLSGSTLNRLVLILLTAMAVLMFAEGLTGLHGDGQPLFDDPRLQIVAGAAAGVVIGGVAALLGVAGGELLIPTLVVLFGVNIKVAGSLSLAVSLPTMIVGLMRYRSAAEFSVLAREKPLLGWMAVGSITGVGLGGLLLGVIPAQALTLLLSVILAVSAINVFRHQTQQHRRADQANGGQVETSSWYVESPRPEQDTPRLAFDLLPWRVNAVILFAIVAVALVAWQSTVAQAMAMSHMAMGLGQLGHGNQAEMSAGAFLTMWIAMMTAMMLPTIAPMVLAHHAVALRRHEGTVSTLASVAGYLMVWWALGIVMWLGYSVFAQWDVGEAAPRWLPLLAGGILFFAGAYQFSRWKHHCANMCRSPLAFVFRHDSRRGIRPAFGAGMMHAAYCVGCCWAAMMVLVVVGLMNLPWMTALFVLFFVEKSWKRGRAVASITGVALMVLGAAVAFHAPLLTTISI